MSSGGSSSRATADRGMLCALGQTPTEPQSMIGKITDNKETQGLSLIVLVALIWVAASQLIAPGLFADRERGGRVRCR